MDDGEYWRSPSMLRIRRRRSPLHQFAESLLERTRLASASTVATSGAGALLTSGGGVPGTDYVPATMGPSTFPLHFERMTSNDPSSTSNVKLVPTALPLSPRVKKFYHFRLAKFLPKFKISFDRLALLAILDRNATFLENLVSVILALSVGLMAALVINYHHYTDLSMFLFCAVTASCQYSLLKSVQPDSASPTHGFNRIIVYSRAIYFVICCGLILILERRFENGSEDDNGLENYLKFLKDGLYVFVLCFPIIFVLGLLPQVRPNFLDDTVTFRSSLIIASY